MRERGWGPVSRVGRFSCGSRPPLVRDSACEIRGMSQIKHALQLSTRDLRPFRSSLVTHLIANPFSGNTEASQARHSG